MIALSAMLACALALLGFCAWLTTKTLPILDAKWKRESAVAQNHADAATRMAAVAERQVTMAEQKAEKPRPKIHMPNDLVARIARWEDDWAREDERIALEQLYAELGDWDAVRHQHAPAMADAQPNFLGIA